jgi:hypothetical protein
MTTPRPSCGGAFQGGANADAASEQDLDDQAFVDAVSADWDDAT